jgi:hypothetical protein
MIIGKDKGKNLRRFAHATLERIISTYNVGEGLCPKEDGEGEELGTKVGSLDGEMFGVPFAVEKKEFWFIILDKIC